MENELVSIRPYAEADRQALLIGLIDLQETERVLTDTLLPGIEMAEPFLKYTLKQVTEKSGALLVAEINSEIVGFVGCWIEQDEDITRIQVTRVYGYISSAYVFPKFRRQGIFAKLNKAAEQHFAQTSTVDHIRISSFAKNTPAIKAYLKAGYEQEQITLAKPLPLK